MSDIQILEFKGKGYYLIIIFENLEIKDREMIT